MIPGVYARSMRKALSGPPWFLQSSRRRPLPRSVRPYPRPFRRALRMKAAGAFPFQPRWCALLPDLRAFSNLSAHPRESGGPVLTLRWIPAFAGMSGVCCTGVSLYRQATAREGKTMKGHRLKNLRSFFAVLYGVLFWAASLAPAGAQDTIKVAVGQIDAWANQVPTLGMKAGIFQKHGIVLDNYGTQGAGETLQAVISGSADIGIG